MLVQTTRSAPVPNLTWWKLNVFLTSMVENKCLTEHLCQMVGIMVLSICMVRHYVLV